MPKTFQLIALLVAVLLLVVVWRDYRFEGSWRSEWGAGKVLLTPARQSTAERFKETEMPESVSK